MKHIIYLDKALNYILDQPASTILKASAVYNFVCFKFNELNSTENNLTPSVQYVQLSREIISNIIGSSNGNTVSSVLDLLLRGALLREINYCPSAGKAYKYSPVITNEIIKHEFDYTPKGPAPAYGPVINGISCDVNSAREFLLRFNRVPGIWKNHPDGLSRDSICLNHGYLNQLQLLAARGILPYHVGANNGRLSCLGNRCLGELRSFFQVDGEYIAQADLKSSQWYMLATLLPEGEEKTRFIEMLNQGLYEDMVQFIVENEDFYLKNLRKTRRNVWGERITDREKLIDVQNRDILAGWDTFWLTKNPLERRQIVKQFSLHTLYQPNYRRDYYLTFLDYYFKQKFPWIWENVINHYRRINKETNLAIILQRQEMDCVWYTAKTVVDRALLPIHDAVGGHPEDIQKAKRAIEDNFYRKYGFLPSVVLDDGEKMRNLLNEDKIQCAS